MEKAIITLNNSVKEMNLEKSDIFIREKWPNSIESILSILRNQADSISIEDIKLYIAVFLFSTSLSIDFEDNEKRDRVLTLFDQIVSL